MFDDSPIQDAAEFVTAVTVLYGVFIAAVRAYKRAAAPIIQFIKDTAESNKIVLEELRWNHGSSLKDSIHRIERRLLLNEARNRVVVQNMKMPFWETNSDGAVVFVSREFCRMSSRSQDDFMGWNWKNTIAHEDRDRLTQEWAEAVSQKREFISEFSFTRPDGSRIPVHSEGYVLYDGEGNMVGHVGTVTPLNVTPCPPTPLAGYRLIPE